MEVELLWALFLLQPTWQLIFTHICEVACQADDFDDRLDDELGWKEILDLWKVRAAILCQVENLKCRPNGLVVAAWGPPSHFVHIFAELEVDFIVTQVQFLQVSQFTQSVDLVCIFDLIVGEVKEL